MVVDFIHQSSYLVVEDLQYIIVVTLQGLFEGFTGFFVEGEVTLENGLFAHEAKSEELRNARNRGSVNFLSSEGCDIYLFFFWDDIFVLKSKRCQCITKIWWLFFMSLV